MKCKELIHPFQNDPGTSQSQRVIDDLLSGQAKIDGRTMADLLDYFMQLSKQIKYYDNNLITDDWQSFFKNSLPFIVTSIIKFNPDAVNGVLEKQNTKFRKKPTNAGLQLLLNYFNVKIINALDGWRAAMADSGLPVAPVIGGLIKKNLAKKIANNSAITNFIRYANTAVKYYRIKPFDFKGLCYNSTGNFDPNNVWGLVQTDLYQYDAIKLYGKTKRARLIALYDAVEELSTPFLDVITKISGPAELSIDQSIFPLQQELKQNHTPHLALLFAFLKLFQHIQSDLNSYTKKHLDFFYRQVLDLMPAEAIADKAYIVFDIQKQLGTYLLQKGLLVKDGKDNNKAEILFALDDEIVVNKAQVTDVRTLFLNNETVQDITYVQGAYMAPAANKADGIDKDFKSGAPNSWPTVGAHYSKYQDPENGFYVPYPNARISFVLASPVLLLNEGTRNITITLSCELNKDYCSTLLPPPVGNNPCCDDPNPTGNSSNEATDNLPDFYDPTDLYASITGILNEQFYYINQNLLNQAIKAGIGKDLQEALEKFLTVDEKLCYCSTNTRIYECTVTSTEFQPVLDLINKLSDDKKSALLQIFYPRRVFNVVFSGEKKWITPSAPASGQFLTFSSLTGNLFTITINALLNPDDPAVTFYNKDALKEDIDNTLPVVKIELDDKIKISVPINPYNTNSCCCENPPTTNNQEVSLYHFFRDVIIDDTQIQVQVCGLKNFVVQNDESLQDVNKPIYPFGTRPDIIGFDAVNPVAGSNKNLVGPNFYIGSKEIFCKKWNDVYINLNWKDKPVDFNDYYKAYCADPSDPLKLGLSETKFQVNISVLQNGPWLGEKLHALPPDPRVPAHVPPFDATTVLNSNGDPSYNNRELFKSDGSAAYCSASGTTPFEQTIYISNSYFTSLSESFDISQDAITKYEAGTLNGFIKLNLQNQDFLQKNYSFVLARQMMALGKLPDGKIDSAIYYDSTSGKYVVFSSDQLFKDLNNATILANYLDASINTIKTDINLTPDIPIVPTPATVPLPHNPADSDVDDTNNAMQVALNATNPEAILANALVDSVQNTVNAAPSFANYTELPNPPGDLKGDADKLVSLLNDITTINTGADKLQAIIPNEPWTPIIKNMSIDYTATASIQDINLIHLYPYQGTYKHEELQLHPSLFPTFCDEGNLYIGINGLVPGSNVNFLFQMAEATADTEDDPQDVLWYYLQNNVWKQLRTGFEILDDATKNLSASGIIKIATPGNMTNDNTILPSGLHWVKASIGQQSGVVCETISILTQAIRATFTNDSANDKLRLATPLPAGSITKLEVADASVKLVNQPYDSFGGRVPESEGYYYVRVSELLRHKGRAIQKFDYERIALDAFPEIFKAKCINHTFGLNAHKYIADYPLAPGYVLLAVIPNMNILNASGSFEPRVPLSILEALEALMRQRTSPFVRFRAMNPRYEKVDFCLRVKLYPGKDENYYKSKLAEDLREFLAPWAVGQYDKLTFGQIINRSDIIRFLETRDYVDYVIELKWRHDEDETNLIPTGSLTEISPITPRSILIAGDIDVCIQQNDCETWGDNSCSNKPELITNYCEENNTGEQIS